MNENEKQEETPIDSKNVIPGLRELLKEDIIKHLFSLVNIINAKIFEHIVKPELERCWESNDYDFARGYFPLIAQILFGKTKEDELEIYVSFDSNAIGEAIIDRKRKTLSLYLIRNLLSKNRKPNKILVNDPNVVAYITWVRETKCGYRAYPQIDRLLKHLLDKPPKICPVCGRAFIAMRIDKVYCSTKCKDAGAKRRKREKKN